MTAPRRDIFSQSDMGRRYEMRNGEKRRKKVKKKVKKRTTKDVRIFHLYDYTKLFSRDIIDSHQIKNPISRKVYCFTRA